MPSNTSNAVGTSQQYLPQEATVYQKQLNGVPLQWNVTKAQDNGGALLANIFNDLGRAIDNEAQSKQKRMIEIAEAVAPKAYGRLSEEQRMQADARGMLMENGNYDLIDNPYALAKIDSLKGTELSTRIQQAYQDKMNSEEIKGSVADQVADFENFTQDYIDQHLGSESISNEYAFNSSIDAGKVEGSTTVAKQWFDKKSTLAKLESAQGFKSLVSNTTRGFLGNTPENIHAGIDAMVDTLRQTNDGDGEALAKKADLMIQSIVANGGGIEALEYLKDLPWTPSPLDPTKPRTFGDVFDTTGYHDLANKYDDLFRETRFKDLRDQLRGITTTQGLDTFFSNLKKNNPEEFRQLAGEYDRYYQHIQAQNRSATKKQSKALAKQASQVRTASNLLDYADAIEKGLQATPSGLKVPNSDADLKALGMDKDMYLQAMRGHVSKLINDGNWNNIEKYITNSYIGKDVKEWVSNNLDVDLRQVDKGLSPVVRYGLSLDDNKPHLLTTIFNNDQANRITLLNTMLKQAGTEDGARMYAQASTKLNDSSYVTESQKALAKDWGDQALEMDSVVGHGKADIPLTSKGQPSVFNHVQQTALMVYASGQAQDAKSAVAMAKTMVGANYVGVKQKDSGVSYVIPKTLLDNMYKDEVNGTREAPAAAFVYTMDKYIKQLAPSGKGVSVEYDDMSTQEPQYVIKKWGTTKSISVPAQAIAEEAYGNMKGKDFFNEDEDLHAYGLRDTQYEADESLVETLGRTADKVSKAFDIMDTQEGVNQNIQDTRATNMLFK